MSSVGYLKAASKQLYGDTVSAKDTILRLHIGKRVLLEQILSVTFLPMTVHLTESKNQKRPCSKQDPRSHLPVMLHL